jgi:hypothetical protein
VFINGLIADNLLRDNEAWGLWLDNVWQGTRVTRNIALNNRQAGLFVEMGRGPLLVDHNLFINTRQGDGVYSHDASGVTYAHNMFYGNSGYGLNFRVVTKRRFLVWPARPLSFEQPLNQTQLRREQVAAADMALWNNLILANSSGAINLPFPGPLAQGNRSDFNLFTAHPPLSFALNTSGGKPLSEIDALLMRTSPASTVGAAIAQPQEIGGQVAQTQLRAIALAQWQALLGADVHSQLAEIRQFSVEGQSEIRLKFNLRLPHAFPPSPSIPGITADFYRHPFPKHPLPGPFQRLQSGENQFVIWPAQSNPD